MYTSLAAALILVVAGSASAQAGVNFNVHLDVPVPVVQLSPPTLERDFRPVPRHRAVASPVVIEEAPSFIYARNLGFHVSVGTPYDIVYLGRSYYLHRDGQWQHGPSYRGPWLALPQHRLPQELRKYRHQQIRSYRDREYRTYLGNREHYRGSWHRPNWERGSGRSETRREERGERWEDRRGERREDRRGERWEDRSKAGRSDAWR